MGGAAYELLRGSLPFGHADQLAMIWSDLPKSGYLRAPLSSPELFDLRQRSRSFSDIAAITVGTRTLGLASDPQQIGIGFVTSNFFPTLQVKPSLGRIITEDDEGTGKAPTIVLSWALWQDRFGGNPSVLGLKIPIDGTPTEIIGVMPASFRMAFAPDANIPEKTAAWMPFLNELKAEKRTRFFLRIFGRLKPGISSQAASSEVAGIGEHLEKEFSDYTASGRRLFVVGLKEDLAAPVKVASFSLLSVGVILLLLGFVNLSGLWVARTVERRQNQAISQALGASVARLRNQIVLQSIIIAAGGCVLGLVAGAAALGFLRHIRPPSLARIDHATLEWPLVIGILGIVTAATVFLAMVSSAVVAPLSPSDIAGTRVDSAPKHRIRSGLIMAQIALTTVLLVYAGLCARTFQNVLRTNIGFQPEHALTFRYSMSPLQLKGDAPTIMMNSRLNEAISSISGVQKAGIISYIPFDHLPNWSLTYRAVESEAGKGREADFRTVSPELFNAIGAHLRAGRFFAETDDQNSPKVMVVDRLLAERTWPGEDAIGKRITMSLWPGLPENIYTVVGVIDHIRNKEIEMEAREQLYLSVRQVPWGPTAFIIRSSLDPSALASAIRERVREINPKIPIWDVLPLQHYYDDAAAERRFTALLLILFALTALVLTSVGIYGLLAFIVTARRNEFGIRMALGAQRGRIIGSMLRESVTWSAIGFMVASALLVPVMKPLGHTLYGVAPYDPLSWLATIVFLLAAVTIASWFPSFRAGRTNPAVLMRGQ
jgi:putative ABC transport system permease protein